MTAGSQTVVNSVRPLKIGEKIREKLGENQEFFLFFFGKGGGQNQFLGPKIKKKKLPDFLRFFSDFFSDFSGLTEVTTVCEPAVTAQN